MGEQLIISIGREYGSGGHAIAEILAKRFELPMYDRNLLDHIAEEKGVDVNVLNKYDEKANNVFLSRRVRGFSNSPEEAIAEMQFDFIKDKAKKGESFVIVGRCSETILRGCEGLVSIFVLADKEVKNERIMKIRNVSSKEAQNIMNRHDLLRKVYHNRYCDIKWGDSRNYDISVNSSRLGIERTADMLESYIKERTGNKQNW